WMERSAIYRRALAPTTLLVGGVGLVASIIGRLAGIQSPRAFGFYWLAVCLVSVAGALLIVRRQALKESAPFWSPPTRRVVQALLPAFFTSPTARIVSSPRAGRMRRESGTFCTARPRDSRKRPAGDHVAPGRVAPALVH